MKKRKKKSKVYFGTPVHEAIIRYNHSDDPIVRNRIYTDEIHTAFLKLAENIINTLSLVILLMGLETYKKKLFLISLLTCISLMRQRVQRPLVISL